MYGAMRDMLDDWGTLLTRGKAFWPVVQASLVGGTTVVNSAIVVRTPGDIFEEWQEQHGFGGDELAQRIWAYQDELEQELHVSEAAPGIRGRSNEMAMKAAQTLGFKGHYMRRNIRNCAGSGQCLQGCRKNRKQSANINFIPEVIAEGGHVVSCAPVKRIVFEKKRAVGVTGHFRHPVTRSRGAAFSIRARKAVIIAASATHSPALLLRSGVKHPALGKNFRAHPGLGCFGIYPDRQEMWNGATQGWASIAYRKDPKLRAKLEVLTLPLELVASRLSGAGPDLVQKLEDFPRMLHWVAAVRADAVGHVKNGFGDKPVVNYVATRDDIYAFRRALKFVAQMHFSVGATHVVPGVVGLPYKLGPDDLGVLDNAPLDARRYTSILSHLFGGAVMGKDPKKSVCDENGWVRGYEHLMVSCAAALPTTLGVNPQHTIMAFSRLRAHQLLGIDVPQHDGKVMLYG
jgi:choline dehydrogenase-like flavoprotein